MIRFVETRPEKGRREKKNRQSKKGKGKEREQTRKTLDRSPDGDQLAEQAHLQGQS